MKKLILLTVVAFLFISCGGSNALVSNPDKSFAHHYNLGLASFIQKDYNGAIKHFKRSIQLNPKIATTQNELATCYLLLNQDQEAATYFEKALTLDASMTSARNNLGVAYTNLKRYKAAEQQFKAVLYDKSYKLNFLPLYNLGKICFDQKRYDEALVYCMEALEEEEQITIDYKIYLHFMLGNIHFIKKNYKVAYTEYEKVLVLKPNMLEAQYKYGVSAYYSGISKETRNILQRLLTLEPGNAWAIKAKKFLSDMDK